MTKSKEQPKGTMSALLQDKPKRGRPRHNVQRQNVYVELSPKQKQLLSELPKIELFTELKRADVPDLIIAILHARWEALRQAMSGRNRSLPEGVTDLESLYLLWDVLLPEEETEQKWTSIRLSPEQVIELGAVVGVFKAALGATRSDTFALGMALLIDYIETRDEGETAVTFEEMKQQIKRLYL